MSSEKRPTGPERAREPQGLRTSREIWMERSLLAAVRFYQAALRPLNLWGCKFYPSCSHYAVEAIERHGWRRGLQLAWARLLRCRPGIWGGFDPVPQAPEESGV